MINKRKIIILTSIILLLIFALFFIDKLIFRQTSTDPDLNNVPTSATSIRIYFSQPIKSVGDVYINSNAIGDYSLEGSVLDISLQGTTLVEDNEYEITINDITSQWFNQKIDTVTKSFTVKYVDFNEQSTQQKKDQVDKSNSGQINDPFLNNPFPIVDDKNRYMIDIVNTGNTDTVQVSLTFLEEVPDYDNGGAVSQISDDQAELYRKSAFEKIKQLGGTPDNYIFLYSNRYLSDKYSEDSYHD